MLTTRSKITLLFTLIVTGIILVLNFIIIQSANESWAKQKKVYLSDTMDAMYSITDAEQMFPNLMVESATGQVLGKQGIFTDEVAISSMKPYFLDDSAIMYLGDKFYYLMQKKTKDNLMLSIADDITDTITTRNELIHRGMYISVFAILAVILIGYFFSGYILRPIRRMNAGAEKFSLDKREIPEVSLAGNKKDEIVMLSHTLESLFERVHMQADKLAQFSDDIAHEVKNKLFEIRSSLETAEKIGDFSEGVRKSKYSIDTLSRLVDALLFLARDERYVLRPTDLVPLLRDYTSQVEDDRVSLVVNTPKFIRSIDTDLFLTAISNLVENARKFTPVDGKVEIVVDHDSVIIRDTGIGMDTGHLEHIFDRFYKVDTARTAWTGYGLGLSITQKVVEYHAMKISVASKIGHGSEFRIW